MIREDLLGKYFIAGRHIYVCTKVTHPGSSSYVTVQQVDYLGKPISSLIPASWRSFTTGSYRVIGGREQYISYLLLQKMKAAL